MTTNYSDSFSLSTKGNDRQFLSYVRWKGYKHKSFAVIAAEEQPSHLRGSPRRPRRTRRSNFKCLSGCLSFPPSGELTVGHAGERRHPGDFARQIESPSLRSRRIFCCKNVRELRGYVYPPARSPRPFASFTRYATVITRYFGARICSVLSATSYRKWRCFGSPMKSPARRWRWASWAYAARRLAWFWAPSAAYWSTGTTVSCC